MKPTNKLQRRVLELSLNLPRIDSTQEEWAYKKCLKHEGYANKSIAFCLDCGKSFSLDLIKRKRAECPSCQTKLSIENTRKTTGKQVNYFAIAEIVEEFQVIRNFELYAYYKKGEPVRYFLHEILQDWILPTFKKVMVGRNHNVQGYCDSWGGDWSIRKENGYYYQNKYEVYPRLYHPKSKFKREYSKYGISYKLQGLTFLQAIKTIPDNPKLETLLKTKQYNLLDRSYSYGSDIRRFWNSIKICIRNKYKVKDASMWVDYLDLLVYFNKDLRNKKYVCPSNLKKEHDRLVEKKRNITRKQKLQKQRADILKADKLYQEQKKNFFGLKFSDDQITIQVLESVKDFLDEGELLKHCLFASGYYKKPDSLILSARHAGVPVETIEVSLSKMKIVQSRGKHNQASEHNKRIKKLLKNNLNLINKRKNHEEQKIQKTAV